MSESAQSNIGIERRSYTIPDLEEEREISFFSSQSQFLHTVNDHFLSSHEPWQRVLHISPKLCQKMAPLDGLDIRRLYADAVSALDEGVQASLLRPVYARMHGSRRNIGSAAKPMEFFNFLASKGFVVIVRAGVVRTAYFVNEQRARNPSTAYLFEHAWHDIRARALTDRYVDSKTGEEVGHHHRTLFAPENWLTCPNPSLRPSRPAPATFQRLLARSAESSGELAGGSYV